MDVSGTAGSASTARTVKSAVQQQFGRAAAGYAVSAVHVGGPDLAAMLAEAQDIAGLSGARVLDVGTGAGHTAFALAPHVATVDALDLTQEMLDQVAKGAAERSLSNVRCRLGDAEALPYPDAHFAVVTSRLCAHHFQDPRAFVAEVARVLQPDGTFLLVDAIAPKDPASDTFFNAFELLRDPSHVRNHSVSQWRTMLADVDVESELLGCFMLYQDFAGWVARLRTAPAAVAQLRHMFESAGDDARREFAIKGFDGSADEPSVSIPCALLRGRRAAA